LSGYAKKSPSVYEQGNADAEENLDALNNLLQSGGRNYFTKKWWSHDVVEMIQPLHLAYTQRASWLAEKSSKHKSKFETD
jgi:hypothetical protein